MQVFQPALKFHSLEAEDILLWKGALKQVHEVFRWECGEPSEPCMTSAGCSVEQMVESNLCAFAERQMLAETGKSAPSVICGATRWHWTATELLSPLCGTDFWGRGASFEDPTKEARKPSWERWWDPIIVWPMAYETYRWTHLCVQEITESDWHQLVTEEVSELFIAISPPIEVSEGITWNVSTQVSQNLQKWQSLARLSSSQ